MVSVNVPDAEGGGGATAFVEQLTCVLRGLVSQVTLRPLSMASKIIYFVFSVQNPVTQKMLTV